MPISTSYPKGVPIEDADLFVGTKASNNRTVNYTAEGIANYLNTNSSIAIGGQMSFQFVISPNVPKTISFEGGGGNNTSFSAITKLIVSSLDVSSTDITIFLNYLTNSDILLSQQNQPNYFGHYKIVSYTQIGITDFYELVLEFIGGNGAIGEDLYYDIVSFIINADVPLPTLQNVLDNNHDLVDNNNFQGTGAGVDNVGSDVNAFGEEAGFNNSGVGLNAMGFSAGRDNRGSGVNALGEGSAEGNTGNNINAIGATALRNNTADFVNAFGQGAGDGNTFKNVNLFGFLSTADAENQNVFSKWISGVTKYLGHLSFNNITADRKWELQDSDGTIAHLSDIPTQTSALINDGEDGINPFITLADIPPSDTTTRYVSSFTATAGQTLFTVIQILPVGYFDVYLNGVKIDSFVSTDYTITLDDPCRVGDLIDIISYNVLSLTSRDTRRNATDSVNSNTNYCGVAPNGSLETADVWTIYKIVVADDGSVTTTSAIDVAWTDREIVIYT